MTSVQRGLITIILYLVAGRMLTGWIGDVLVARALVRADRAAHNPAPACVWSAL